MDNVSHTLVGAAMGHAGLKRLSGLGVATLMIAANIPDVDVLAIPFGENLTFRRGWTHGPVGLLVLPILLAAAMYGFDRWQTARGTRPPARSPVKLGGLLLLAYLGALSHPFLDWLNSYGIRLLMPFSQEWYYGDALFIVDPWLWAMLGIGLYWGRRRRRSGVKSAERPTQLALALLSAYILLMIVGSRYASETVRSHAEGAGVGQIEDVMAGPVPVNPLKRDIIIEQAAGYRVGVLTFTPRPVVELDAEFIPNNRDLPEVIAATAYADIRDYLYWSRFPFFLVERDESGALVSVHDVRFRGRGGTWASRSVRVTGNSTGTID